MLSDLKRRLCNAQGRTALSIHEILSQLYEAISQVLGRLAAGEIFDNVGLGGQQSTIRRTILTAVSYTHLTLPTICSV